MIHRNHRGPGRRRYGGGASTNETDAEFLGVVTAVGNEPAHVSGVVPAYQALTVDVTEITRGELDLGPLGLDVLVVAGNPHIGWGAQGLPALDPAMVQPGVSMRIWANHEAGYWRAIEISTDGPQPMLS